MKGWKLKSTPLKKQGKRAKLWQIAKAKFERENPPEDGYHYCHYGGGALEYLRVDHKNGRLGSLLTDKKNLVKTCDYHNGLKGSMKYDKFIKLLEDNREYRVCRY